MENGRRETKAMTNTMFDTPIHPSSTPSTLSTPAFTPSPQQLAVYAWVKDGTGHAFVEAVAGSGKTSTLVSACESMHGDVAYAAFNKAIAQEVEAKIRHLDNVKSATFHSFGFAAWRPHARGVKVNERDKWRAMMDENRVPDGLRVAVGRVVSIAKQSAMGVLWEPDDMDEWLRIIYHYDILLRVDEGADDENTIDRLIYYVRSCLKWSYEVATKIIDFDDMLWVPLVAGVPYRTYDWVLVDEAQDTNAARRETAKRMLAPGGRAIWVGDRNQCQPTGTIVPIVKKKGNRWHGAVIEPTPIEKVQVGDQVVSYETNDCAFVRGREVRKVASRYCREWMTRVTLPDGTSSSYTPLHKCLVSFSALRDRWVVYLMERNGQYRVGKCRMSYVHASGLSARMHHEKANAAWILELHEDEEDAFYREQAISGRFGLPQLMFNPTNQTRTKSDSYLPQAWKFIGDNSERALDCLTHFGRRHDSPLMARGTGKQQTIKRPIITAACNIVDGCLVLPWAEQMGTHVKASDWVPVKVSQYLYAGDVYSLEVDKGMYVADGIVTHNSIYGFCGADSDAIDRIIRDFDCTLLPLTVTFRCSKAATSLAQTWVPHITAHDNNNEGSVDYSGLAECQFEPGDAVLCRLNKPLVALAFSLIRAGVGCHVEGRDIGKGLERLATKWKVDSVRALVTNLEGYRRRETEKLMARDAPTLIEALNDRIDTLLIITEDCETVSEVVRKIERLFKDSNGNGGRGTVTLSTVHKAKGREWSKVFILGYSEYMPSKWARQPWEMVQETNLMYVAVTRTKDQLVLTGDSSC